MIEAILIIIWFAVYTAIVIGALVVLLFIAVIEKVKRK